MEILKLQSIILLRLKIQEDKNPGFQVVLLLSEKDSLNFKIYMKMTCNKDYYDIHEKEKMS